MAYLSKCDEHEVAFASESQYRESDCPACTLQDEKEKLEYRVSELEDEITELEGTNGELRDQLDEARAEE